MTPAAEDIYKPRGAAREIFRLRDPEVILAGPAGTGKTRSILEKLDAVAEKYPNMRGLMVRKTRNSLTQTGLVTFENHVLRKTPDVQFNTVGQEYRYKNGSIIAVAGLDKDIKIMSGEFDLIVVIEATELSEADWEALTTRLRNGRVPYQQIIADCNPADPKHWIRQRVARGSLTLLESRHVDNPILYDDRGELTARGALYMSKLEALTGIRRSRLLLGLWVAAEGAIYEDVWSRAENVVSRFEIPAAWPRYWTIDFGYINPFVFQAWARSPDDELYCYAEIYQTRRLVEDLAGAIAELTRGDPRPVEVICDHDAEDRATLERHLSIITTGAHKTVSPGLQATAARMKRRANGRRGLYFLEDSRYSLSPLGELVPGPDPDLEDRKLPTQTIDEVESYVWDTRQGRRRGEDPLKENDHGLDATRYLVAEIDIKGHLAEAESFDLSLMDV